jgi:hypothetical protein
MNVEPTIVETPDIVQTPELKLYPPVECIEGIDRQFVEIRAKVEAGDAVTAARQEYEKAVAKRASFQRARTRLNQRASVLFGELRTAQQIVEKALIERYGGDAEADTDSRAIFAEQEVAEREHRAITRTIEYLVVHGIPLAQIECERSEAHLLAARGKAYEGIAAERIAKASELVREAVEFEGVLKIDTREGISGYVANLGDELKKRAEQVKRNADESERSYTERVALIASKEIKK